MQSFTDRMKEAVKHLSAAKDILACGPLDYYMEKLVSHSTALIDRFAPIKVGERAVIIKQIECKGGWAGREDTLHIGAIGTVRSVDYIDNLFVFEFVPDIEWWKDHEGIKHRRKTPHSYLLSENKLKKLERTNDGT